MEREENKAEAKGLVLNMVIGSFCKEAEEWGNVGVTVGDFILEIVKV